MAMARTVNQRLQDAPTLGKRFGSVPWSPQTDLSCSRLPHPTCPSSAIHARPSFLPAFIMAWSLYFINRNAHRTSVPRSTTFYRGRQSAEGHRRQHPRYSSNFPSVRPSPPTHAPHAPNSSSSKRTISRHPAARRPRCEVFRWLRSRPAGSIRHMSPRTASS